MDDPEPEVVDKTVDQEYEMARFEHEDRMKKWIWSCAWLKWRPKRRDMRQMNDWRSSN